MKIKVCIDPGHGRDSFSQGLYDTGAVNGKLQEATLVLPWAETLRAELVARGIEVFMTRSKREDSAPLGQRAKRAIAAGCTHFISLHINDFDTPAANGYETLAPSRLLKDPWITQVHAAALGGLGLRDRGIKARDNLAVLKFPGPVCMLEMGFISNAGDMLATNNAKVMQATCKALADTLAPLPPQASGCTC